MNEDHCVSMLVKILKTKGLSLPLFIGLFVWFALLWYSNGLIIFPLFNNAPTGIPPVNEYQIRRLEKNLGDKYIWFVHISLFFGK